MHGCADVQGLLRLFSVTALFRVQVYLKAERRICFDFNKISGYTGSRRMRNGKDGKHWESGF